MKKKIIIILALIVLLGGGLRFWRLASHPVSLSIDEVAIGYNSYSILKTARDEHGQFLPLAFRSIGDFKPPILIYLSMPAILLFGLNEFGVRLTIALIGTLTIISVYLLTKELTKNETISLLTSFSLAISPWHIQFSRATFEAILALFFMITGAWLFLKTVRQSCRFLWLSAIFLSLAMYSYHSERLVVPLLVLGMTIIFWQELWQHKKETLLAFFTALLICIPFIHLMLGPEGQTRAVHAFINRDYEINRELNQPLDFLGHVFASNPVILFNFWLKRYSDYWNLRFMFFDGIKLTLPGTPDVGLFHLFEIIPFLIGSWFILFKKKVLKGKKKQMFFCWLLLGPLAASLANNPQHPLRSLTIIPMFQIIVGIGGFWLLSWFGKKGVFKKALVSLSALVIITVSLIYYGDIYYVHFPIHFSECWSYGLKDVAQYAWAHKDEYDEIVIDPTFGTRGPDTVSVPYLYVLFYGQYDPYSFQNSPRRGALTGDLLDFENFTFREIYWPQDRSQKGNLFIGSPWRLPPEDLSQEQILKKITFKNGATSFLIVETTKSAKSGKKMLEKTY